jgi:hypothetical protein
MAHLHCFHGYVTILFLVAVCHMDSKAIKFIWSLETMFWNWKGTILQINLKFHVYQEEYLHNMTQPRADISVSPAFFLQNIHNTS